MKKMFLKVGWNLYSFLVMGLENNIDFCLKKLENDTFFSQKAGKVEFRNSGNPS